MIRGFYTAKSGLMAHQEHMNTIANNMANANTVAFKPMRTSFADLIYQNLNREKGENVAMIGHGVKINKNDIMMAGGPLSATDNAFDFAILDEGGFFAVEGRGGEPEYTRAGNFSMSNEDGTYYLVAGSGARVLDDSGQQIEIEFDDKGVMQFDPAVIGVYRFDNPYALTSIGNNTYAANEVTGEATAVEQPQLKSGYLEGSGVEIGNEMVNVIESSKAFSFSSRMLQVADEVEQTVNSLRQ